MGCKCPKPSRNEEPSAWIYLWALGSATFVICSFSFSAWLIGPGLVSGAIAIVQIRRFNRQQKHGPGR